MLVQDYVKFFFFFIIGISHFIDFMGYILHFWKVEPPEDHKPTNQKNENISSRLPQTNLLTTIPKFLSHQILLTQAVKEEDGEGEGVWG